MKKYSSALYSPQEIKQQFHYTTQLDWQIIIKAWYGYEEMGTLV